MFQAECPLVPIRAIDDARYKLFVNTPFAKEKTGRSLFEQGKLRPTTFGIHKNKLETACCYQDEGTYWGMSYQENAKNASILTEISFFYDKETRRVIFSIRVVYQPKTLWEEFSPTVPGIVQDLFKVPHFNICGGDGMFTLHPPEGQSPKRKLITKEDAEDFKAYLLTPKRKRTLLLAVFSPDTPKPVHKALTELAWKLVGKSLVFTIARNSEAYPIISQMLKGTSNCPAHIKSLYLLPPCEAEGKRIRCEDYSLDWLSGKDNDPEEQERELLPALLGHLYRRHPVHEDGAVSYLGVLFALDASLIRKEEAEEKKAREAQQQEEREAANVRLAALRQERDEARQLQDLSLAENSDYRATIDRLKSENQKLYVQLERERAQHHRDEESEHIANLREKIDALIKVDQTKLDRAESVKALQYLFEDRLIITAKAIDSLNDAPKLFMLSDALAFLLVLYAVVYPSHKEENLGTRRDLYVQNHPLVQKYNLKYSANESTQTVESRKWSNLRTVEYNKKSYFCESHLKKSQSYRAYFVYSKDLDKIIICHIGGHLNTAGTKDKGL